jgi:hypothetical protein
VGTIRRQEHATQKHAPQGQQRRAATANAKLSLYQALALFRINREMADFIFIAQANQSELNHQCRRRYDLFAAYAVKARSIYARLLHEARFNFVTQLDEEAMRANIAPVLRSNAQNEVVKPPENSRAFTAYP